MIARKILLLPPLAFLLELVLGGPGRWATIGGLTVRYWLFIATILSLAALSSANRPWRLRLDEVFLFLVVSVGALLWVGLIPLVRWVPLQHAVADGDALGLLFVYFPLAHLVRRDVLRWSSAKDWLLVAASVVALAHLVLFALGQFGGVGVGVAVAELMRRLMGSSAIYIGYTGNFFRVMWISSLFVLFGFFLALREVERRGLRAILLLLLGTALIVTYTRGFWLGAVAGLTLISLGGLLSSLRKIEGRVVVPFPRARLLGKVLAVGCLLYLLAALTEFQPVARLMTMLEPEADVSISARSAQLGRLLDAWSGAPLTGTGFGSHVRGYPGDPDAPFSYELTGVTLLMKTGIVGLALAICVIAIFARRSVRAARSPGGRRWFFGWLATAAAVAFAFQTNPYLMNFVGMSIVVFLMVDVVEREAGALAASDAANPPTLDVRPGAG